VTLIVVATCIRLGFWQLDRLHGRKDANAAIAAAEAMPSLPLKELMAGTGDPGALRFHPAVATGTYDPAHEVLLYGRSSVESETGDQVLTPLRLDDGTAIMVDRGWIPIDQPVPVPGEAAAPAGTVTVTGVLFPPDAISNPASPMPSGDRITKVDLGQVGASLPYPILPVYLLLQRQAPPQTGALPEPPPLPPLTNGPHLSYTLQWFAFAATAVIGFVVLLRRDRRETRATVASAPGEKND
jgi:surfeit locus 1 family protein